MNEQIQVCQNLFSVTVMHFVALSGEFVSAVAANIRFRIRTVYWLLFDIVCRLSTFNYICVVMNISRNRNSSKCAFLCLFVSLYHETCFLLIGSLNPVM